MLSTSLAGRLGVATVAALLTLLVPASPARAHNTLRSSSPARDAALPVAPTEVSLEFSARLDPAFATVVLTDANKRRIPTSDPVVVGATSTITLTGTLPNGTYTVAYRVVSTDGHPLRGSYPFSVADPTASAAPISAAGASADAGGRRTDGDLRVVFLVSGAVLAALVAVAVGLLRSRPVWCWARRRRSTSAR
ncbi:copper resistance CopC family protein [Micromonospora chokoriensis]|uniref:copper resistance CopC family protein n=1 Tax=Micromonospora chokoriensis TaxID=356851 RepID=UPI00068E3CB2|nr:copper resistance CopC family protein [Micromonospora chokoriensis]